MKPYILLSLLALMSLSSCKFEASLSNGEELQGEGVTFLVPTETSSSSSGSGGISFDGESVKAKTDGEKLTVNGKDYGALSTGDTVDLREKGKVLVNGTERKPATDSAGLYDRLKASEADLIKMENDARAAFKEDVVWVELPGSSWDRFTYLCGDLVPDGTSLSSVGTPGNKFKACVPVSQKSRILRKLASLPASPDRE